MKHSWRKVTRRFRTMDGPIEEVWWECRRCAYSSKGSVLTDDERNGACRR